MKVAVTAQKPDETSQIDTRFGRAKWIIVIDTETGQSDVHSNEVNLNAVQGAGIQTGRNIANLGVDAVITGNVGPNAYKTLVAAQVQVFLASEDNVQQAVAALKRGELEQVKHANVEGHWI